MSLKSDTSNSGIYVIEGPASGQPVPVDGESVTAFIGPTPRGPVDYAVKVSSLTDFQKVFGVPDYHSRLEFAIQQFFANGGSNAVVVRVSGTMVRNQIRLPGPAGELVLAARNPGPLECLRASIDWDGHTDDESFNLVVQRLQARGSAWIDAQEYYRGISVDPANRDYVGYVLSQSELVSLSDSCPSIKPDPTYKPTTIRESAYIDSESQCIDSPPPSDYDLIGSTALGTGLNALDEVPDIGQICLLSGAESAPLGPIAMLAADQFCRDRQALLIVDPPERWQSVDDVISDQQRSGFNSPNAVTWFPGAYVKNSLGEKLQTSIVGAVAASIVAGDRVDGVSQLHQAGPLIMRSGTRLRCELESEDVQRLSRAGINAICQRSALHYQLLGNVTQARYGSISGQWNELDLRRQVLFILRRLRAGTRWTLFQPSNPDTWRVVVSQISEFLTELHARSILAGDTAQQSFFVTCDGDTNAGLQGKSGELAFVMGFALRAPGEYLAFRFHRYSGSCKITELGWQSGFARAS